MGISFYISNKDNIGDKKTNLIFIIQLVLNYLWSFVFFNFQNFLLAFILCIILDILIAIWIIRLFNTNTIFYLVIICYLFIISSIFNKLKKA